MSTDHYNINCEHTCQLTIIILTVTKMSTDNYNNIYEQKCQLTIAILTVNKNVNLPLVLPQKKVN